MEVYDIIYLRKYIAVAPGRKGITMLDTEAQILELFRLLSSEQQRITVLSAILSSLASEQEASSADLASNASHSS